MLVLRRLHDAASAAWRKGALRGAASIGAIVHAVVALLELRLHDPVAAAGARDAAGGAATVLAEVDAVVALLEGWLDDPVAAVGRARFAARHAAPVRTVVLAVVADFAPHH